MKGDRASQILEQERRQVADPTRTRVNYGSIASPEVIPRRTSPERMIDYQPPRGPDSRADDQGPEACDETGKEANSMKIA
jgi:hypothetical protein